MRWKKEEHVQQSAWNSVWDDVKVELLAKSLSVRDCGLCCPWWLNPVLTLAHSYTETVEVATRANYLLSSLGQASSVSLTYLWYNQCRLRSKSSFCTTFKNTQSLRKIKGQHFFRSYPWWFWSDAISLQVNLLLLKSDFQHSEWPCRMCDNL